MSDAEKPAFAWRADEPSDEELEAIAAQERASVSASDEPREECPSTLPPELLATLRLAWQERKQDYAPILAAVLAEVGRLDREGAAFTAPHPDDQMAHTIYKAAFLIREARRLSTEGA